MSVTRVWISFKLNDRRLKAKTDTWEVWEKRRQRVFISARFAGSRRGANIVFSRRPRPSGKRTASASSPSSSSPRRKSTAKASAASRRRRRREASLDVASPAVHVDAVLQVREADAPGHARMPAVRASVLRSLQGRTEERKVGVTIDELFDRLSTYPRDAHITGCIEPGTDRAGLMVAERQGPDPDEFHRDSGSCRRA